MVLENTSKLPRAKDAVPGQSSIFLLTVALAVALCIACCTLILLIPTESISVDTVYQGF